MTLILFALFLLVAQSLPVIPQKGELSSYITAHIVNTRGEFWAVDSNETRYDTLSALWEAKLGRDYPDEDWGDKTHAWWSKRDPSVSGVLGETMTPAMEEDEEAHSRSLLTRFAPPPSSHRPVRCLSVGSGIGREAMGALIPWCSVVDLLEPQAHMMEAAQKAFPASHLGRVFLERAQQHTFDPQLKYDVVWVQWCTNYLPDAAMAQFIRDAVASLNPGGVIVLKDNISAFADGVYNDENHMLIRSGEYLKALIYLANPGLSLIVDEPQDTWPENMFPLRAFVFTLREETTTSSEL